MGWSSAVTLLLAIFRNLVFAKAGLPEALEVAKIKEVLAGRGHRHPEHERFLAGVPRGRCHSRSRIFQSVNRFQPQTLYASNET